MITIALDETGVFDSGYTPQREVEEPTLIGGILYDDDDLSEELQYERERLEAYYKEIINTINNSNGMNARYPYDLHRNNNNEHIVKKVKAEIGRTLKEYLRNGSYNGKQLPFDSPLPERKGKYYVCAVVKSERGKSALLKSDVGTFFRDGVASNIYFHMISDVVEHLIFHNPLIPDAKRFRLDIASRESADISESESKEDYKKQGFKNRKEENEHHNSISQKLQNAGLTTSEHYQLMNADVFRTVLTEHMLSSSKKDLQIESFYVDSITYRFKGSGRNERLIHEDQVFMYLADFVCSYISYKVGKYDIESLSEKAERLTKNNALVFSYDEADEKLKKALQLLEQNEYYDALSEIYDIEQMNTREGSLYSSKWVPFVEKTVIDKVKRDINSGDKTSSLYEAVQELRNTYYSNHLNSERSFCIFSILKRAYSKVKSGADIDRLGFYINEIGLAAYCHRGDTVKATPYFRKCERLAYAVGIDDYIVVRNRYATSLMDAFDYARAIEVIRQTAELMQGIYYLGRKTFGNRRKPIGKEELGKVMSLAGQCASFMGDSESAQVYFDEALCLFDDAPVNKKITESYRLHYLIDIGDKELYQESFTDYTRGFGKSKSQVLIIKLMADQGIVSFKYAFYLYLKGLYIFGSVEDIKQAWEDIKEMEESIDNTEKRGHPWELIYKYMCLIAIKIDEIDMVNNYKNILNKMVRETKDRNYLVRVIILGSMADVCHALNNSSREMQLYLKMYDILTNLSPGISDNVNITSNKSKKNYVKGKIRYMYC